MLLQPPEEKLREKSESKASKEQAGNPAHPHCIAASPRSNCEACLSQGARFFSRQESLGISWAAEVRSTDLGSAMDRGAWRATVHGVSEPDPADMT